MNTVLFDDYGRRFTEVDPPTCNGCQNPLTELRQDSYRLVRTSTNVDWVGLYINDDCAHMAWRVNGEQAEPEELGPIQGYEDELCCPHCGRTIEGFELYEYAYWINREDVSKDLSIKDEIRMELAL